MYTRAVKHRLHLVKSRDFFETASAQMSWIKAWYEITLLEFNLCGVGYVSCVQVEHNVREPKRIYFLLLANIETAVNLFCL
jgi:hypothetical protein